MMHRLKELLSSEYLTETDRYFGEYSQTEGCVLIKIHHIQMSEEERQYTLQIEIDNKKPLVYAHLEPSDLSEYPFRLIAPIESDFLDLITESVKNIKELYDMITADMLIRVDR